MEEHADKLDEEIVKVSREERKKHKPYAKESDCGCPGARMVQFDDKNAENVTSEARIESKLRQWPIQLNLLPPFAPFFKNADLVIAADCVAFSYPNFHQDFLKGNAIAIGCPKLDDASAYVEKITQIIKVSELKSITVLHMEVPCCSGMIHIVQEAIKKSGISVQFETVQISIKGEIMQKNKISL